MYRCLSNGLICSGRGLCHCGACKCNKTSKGSIFGKHCEFDNFSCPSGWSGEKCDCSLDTKNCINENNICSGNGKCLCNKCSCKQSFNGKFCNVSIMSSQINAVNVSIDIDNDSNSIINFDQDFDPSFWILILILTLILILIGLIICANLKCWRKCKKSEIERVYYRKTQRPMQEPRIRFSDAWIRIREIPEQIMVGDYIHAILWKNLHSRSQFLPYAKLKAIHSIFEINHRLSCKQFTRIDFVARKYHNMTRKLCMIKKNLTYLGKKWNSR